MLIKQAQSAVPHSPFQLPNCLPRTISFILFIRSFLLTSQFPMTDGGHQTHDAEHSRTVPNNVPIDDQANVVGEEPIKTFRVLLTGFGVSAVPCSPAVSPAILCAMNSRKTIALPQS